MSPPPGRRSPGMLLLFLLVMASVAVMAGLFLYSAFVPWGVTTLGRRTSGIVIPFAQARWIWGGLGTIMLLLVGWQTLRAVAAYSRLPRSEEPRTPGLHLGEAVRWSGRPGLRSVRREHAFVAVLLLIGMIPLVLTLSWVHGLRHYDGWHVRGFQLLFAFCLLTVFGPMAAFPLWTVLMRENHWLHELTGKLLITDRRLLWRSASGKIAHEVDGKAIEDVVLVPARGGRSDIHLRVRTHPAKVKDWILFAVPDPHAAVAALSRIAARTD